MEIVKMIVAVAVCFGASAVGALFMNADSINTWYAQLQKPAITPPDWVFGPAWTILYLMMAIPTAWAMAAGAEAPAISD